MDRYLSRANRRTWLLVSPATREEVGVQCQPTQSPSAEHQWGPHQLGMWACWWLLCLTLTGCNGCHKDEGIPVALESLKNKCVALLENGAEVDKDGKLLSEAAAGFRQITADLPQESLGPQDLCVTLLFQIKSERVNPTGKLSQLEEEFAKTVSALKALTPSEPDAWVLESRFFQDKGDLAKAESLLREAVNKTNSTAATYFQLIELLQASDSGAAPGDIRSLLEAAIKLAPTNLALSTAYLDILAKMQDAPAFAAQFAKCKSDFAPLISRTASPLPKRLDLIQTAIDQQDWKSAQMQATFLRNVLLAEIAYQNDIHLLRPHTLEYVQIKFSKSTSLRTAQAAPAVEFEPVKLQLAAAKVIEAVASDDLDLDGRDDLALLGDQQLQVWSFAQDQPTKILSAMLSSSPRGIALADLDHDYQYRKESLPQSALPTTAAPDAPVNSSTGLVDTDLDVVLWGSSGVILLENVLQDDKQSRQLVARPLSDGMDQLKNVTALSVIDFDHDSDLDLIVASDKGVSLWSNRGDWTFADFTGYSSLPAADKTYSALLALDADRNVLVDILVGAEHEGPPQMLGNNLHGRFHPRQLPWPAELNGAAAALDVIDANRDACWDLVLGGDKGLYLLTMKSPGRHGWTTDSATKLSEAATTGLVCDDFNNDGLVDVVSWGPTGSHMFLGQADGSLVKSPLAEPLAQANRQLLVMDYDGDRDGDLVTLNDAGQLSLVRNVQGAQLQQMEIVLRADEDGSQRPRERCNMHGVGSLVELKSDGLYQARIVRGTRTRFGLGESHSAQVVRVVWTNGTPNNVLDVNNSATVFDQQQLNGSCPYLYAWNGERFEFVTDCLWAAPIGLQFGPGILAPTRDWEYLKIDGSALQPRDGTYQLQLTEELWEAAYFDAVKLFAVDHPANLQVFTNEKVGSPEIAEHKIYTVQDRRLPKVTDQQGRNLSELVAQRDQRYAKSWTQGINQGLTETHWLEIDLNAEESTDETVLFLTGWVFPTCTSLNMALAENPTRPEVQPPSLQVVDAQGNWVQVLPYTGFPGGKTKTIAIDLKGKFLCDDHRVRLVSNMELCWDEIFFTVNEREANPGMYRVTELPILAADLHYRGFSQQVRRPGNAPNYYDYSQVTTESIWSPMNGDFTRYGDVLPLLQSPDDLQVVLGGGDEITVTFAVDEGGIPDGWVRDFVIFNVGWDKDADLNTMYGQNVGPLPFRAMKSYPYEADQQFPDSAAHRDFIRHYQTRTQQPGLFWNQVRDAL